MKDGNIETSAEDLVLEIPSDNLDDEPQDLVVPAKKRGIKAGTKIPTVKELQERLDVLVQRLGKDRILAHEKKRDDFYASQAEMGEDYQECRRLKERIAKRKIGLAKRRLKEAAEIHGKNYDELLKDVPGLTPELQASIISKWTGAETGETKP